MEENKIPVNENMPAELKSAIDYLNSNNISLSDRIDDDDDLLDKAVAEGEEDSDFLVSSSDLVNDDIDLDSTNEMFEDDIDEDEDADLSDLDDMF